MDVPGIVEEALDGEEVAADVDLGGDDALFVTPTRTLIYRSEGLLSDESVESYSHEAESLSISEGRRKTRITLDHPIDGVEDFTLPSGAADEAIPAILAGVLRANDVLAEGESVVDSYLFSELTLVITDDRLVKHVGETVWDLDFEEFPFADVTGVYAEKGSVATQLIVEIDGRAERIKTPSDRSREVRETLEDALRRHHRLQPDEDLNDALGPAEPAEPEPEPAEDDAASSASGGMDFEAGVEPLSAGDTTQDGRDPDPRDAEAALDTEPAGASTGDPEQASDAGAPESGGPGSGSGEAASRESSDQESGGGATAADESASGQRGADADEPEATGQSGRSQAAGAGSAQEPAEPNSADGAQSDAEPHQQRQGSETAVERSAEEAREDLEAAGFESSTDPTAELAEEVEELRVAVQKQNKLLTRQHKTIEKLVEELRRGR
jgi:hypothetical protein